MEPMAVQLPRTASISISGISDPKLTHPLLEEAVKRNLGNMKVGSLMNTIHNDTPTSIVLSVNSSLPMAKQSEKVTTDSRIDRLTVWMQNVERECQPVACEVL